MNHLNYLWAMIGTNSGQLQTLLAVIGLIFAVIAALYAKRQIKLSQDQRLFELKLSILSAAYECKDLIYEIKHKNNALKSEFSKILEVQNITLDDLMEGCDYNYHEYFKKMLEQLKTPEEVINKLITGLSDEKQNPSLEELERYLKHLTTSKGGIYHAHNGYLRRIDELKKMRSSIN
ncbi:TPA: hypothetical protein ACIFB5_000496 [Acinetobacter baumannii]|uniref:hypothetical protein n=1 Tax=Acinetobacter baumannii TaxID=470 RepID=UPI001D0EF5E9|nr:hypothetical protein [Acinetobacter baumannii]